MGRPKGSKNGVYSHGTMRRWKQGCRCEPCIEAHEEYLADYLENFDSQ